MSSSYVTKLAAKLRHAQRLATRAQNAGETKTGRKNVVIMGAAGRDFHNFNMKFRDNSSFDVKAFTATQIPGIDGRRYPASLCGELYPDGIAIHEEQELGALILEHEVDEVVFSYSDVTNDHVMGAAAVAMAHGANFSVLGKNDTQLRSSKPVVSVLASRTGCGKSQTSRYVLQALQAQGYKVVAIRHPMPYGDLVAQKLQRYAHNDDLAAHKCTIEEREEYEPYVSRGCVVYAGVDYQTILREAEKEADVIIWDGGNNDMSFIDASVEITVVDPHRPGHEHSFYPGQVNVLTADIVIINKVDSAPLESVLRSREDVEKLNPTAVIIEAASPVGIQGGKAKADLIRGQRALVVEDGPTLTHGGMSFGAGMVAAKKFGAKTVVDPRPFLKGSLAATFHDYPHIGQVLPAMGYGDAQVRHLQDTINAMATSRSIDVVVSGTPFDLSQVLSVEGVPIAHAHYDLQCIGHPQLDQVVLHHLDAFHKQTTN